MILREEIIPNPRRGARIPHGHTFFNRSIPAIPSYLESPPTPHPGTSVPSVHPARSFRARRDTDHDDLRPPLAPSLPRHVGPRKREHGPPAAHHSSPAGNLPRNGSRGNQHGPGCYQKKRGSMVDSTAASTVASAEDEDDKDEAKEDTRTAPWSATVRALGIYPTRR